MTPRLTVGEHLGAAHPLASAAARLCEHQTSPATGVACGPCWETSIRDDERFAVENDLPRMISHDPELVDDVAVERALAGESITLTPAERRAAIATLLRRGRSAGSIATLLGLNFSMVTREVQRSATPAA